MLNFLSANDTANEYGGGIFVADDTDTCSAATRTIFADCFSQTMTLDVSLKYFSRNYFNTFMTNNTATQSRADIYGGLLDRCTANQNAEYYWTT